ncbi:MAG: hypothetical protein ACSHX0_11665 [Akkermansiaceae bacterium]
MNNNQPFSKIARLFICIGVLVLILVAFCGGLFWQMSKVFNNNESFGSSNEWPYLLAERSEEQVEYDEVFARVLNRYPDLDPEWRTVPAEENGFLHLLNLSEYIVGVNGADSNYPLNLSDEERERISESTIEKHEFLDNEITYQALITELERIVAFKQRSCAGIHPRRLIMSHVNVLRNFVGILLHDALAAAELGDQDKAWSRVYTARVIVDHYAQIETVSLIGSTVAIVSYMNVYDSVINDIFPKLELNQSDYSKWRAALASDYSETKLSDLSRGEFNLATPWLVAPFIEKVWLYQLAGTDSVYDSIAEMYLTLNDLSKQGYSSCLESWELKVDLKGARRVTPLLHRPLVSILSTGWEAYTKGFIRSVVRLEQYDAALAILAGEDIPLEPVTGKPYAYDEETRTLSLPDDSRLEKVEVEPIKLPMKL